MKLRVWADFNSCGDGDAAWYWCLRYNHRLLDDVADELALYEGQPIILYYEDSEEEFEFDAVLSKRGERWMALTEESSFRRIRG